MPEQLWGKDLPLDALVHRFTVGEDPQTDLHILPYDALGSAAHARGLAWVGLISVEDAKALVGELKNIQQESIEGKVVIRQEQEDCHTAIEALLTERLGEAGKRVHLGRSRNDQVALAVRLWMRDQALRFGSALCNLTEAFLAFAKEYEDVPLPGYTHMRRAMPSTFGQWAASFAEGLLEEVRALQGLDARFDRCPLGGAAGFGVPLPLDREYTAQLLGFSRPQISPIDVQNSRGRHESALVHWLTSVSLVWERFLWDALIYTTEEYGFLTLPDEFTTGSSIMPQKRNPDVLELARGRCREMRGFAATLDHLAGGLPSSYHRDYQLIKKPTVQAMDSASQLVQVLSHLVPRLIVNADKAKQACSPELYATQEACDLALEGMAFRDAYREVAKKVLGGNYVPPTSKAAEHLGSPGNLGLEAIVEELDMARSAIDWRTEQLRVAEEQIWQQETITTRP